jgi:hypothetical protein
MTHEDQTEFYTCPICGAGIGNDIDGAIEHDCPLEEQYVKDMTHTDSVETAAHNIVAHILGTTNWEADTTFIEDEIRTTLHQELQKAREEEVSNIIADYMEALGTVQLPQEVWLWIADINGKYLNKTLKENI